MFAEFKEWDQCLIRRIKDNPVEVVKLLEAKGKKAEEEIGRILSLTRKRRSLIQQTEALKAEQNKVSKQIPQMKKENKDTTEIMALMKNISETIKATMRSCARRNSS